jgi:hypothetical protein
VVLWELCTRDLPFKSFNKYQIIFMVCNLKEVFSRYKLYSFELIFKLFFLLKKNSSACKYLLIAMSIWKIWWKFAGWQRLKRDLHLKGSKILWIKLIKMVWVFQFWCHLLQIFSISEIDKTVEVTQIETLETSCNYETENVSNQNVFDDFDCCGFHHDEIQATVTEPVNRVERTGKYQSNGVISIFKSFILS